MNQNDQLQAAIVAASQNPKGTLTMPMLGTQSMQPGFTPGMGALPSAAPVSPVSAPAMPTTASAPTPPPPMLGVPGTPPGAPPPPMLDAGGTYIDPNQQPPPPTFTWGADPSGLGGAAANLGGYMSY